MDAEVARGDAEVARHGWLNQHDTQHIPCPFWRSSTAHVVVVPHAHTSLALHLSISVFVPLHITEFQSLFLLLKVPAYLVSPTCSRYAFQSQQTPTEDHSPHQPDTLNSKRMKCPCILPSFDGLVLVSFVVNGFPP